MDNSEEGFGIMLVMFIVTSCMIGMVFSIIIIIDLTRQNEHLQDQINIGKFPCYKELFNTQPVVDTCSATSNNLQ